ncbi:MAG: flagellar hook-basal body complex protein FliE [Pseudomonadota bacterium]
MRIALERPSLAPQLRSETTSGAGRSGDFSSALAQATEHFEGQLRTADHVVEQAASEKVDVHQAALALERADLELRLLVKVRNKVVDAYREIMRLSV